MGLISSQGLALDQEFYDASRERGRNGIFRLRMDCQALIAIIDDEVSGRTALKRYLRAEGFAVKGHASATKFLHSFSERRPDCILLDLHMPGMDGFELLEANSQGAS